MTSLSSPMLLFKKTQIMCESCAYVNEDREAESFCRSCNDPEPMCSSCASQHLKQKMFRNHELCYNLNELRKEPTIKIVYCAPCEYERENVPACSFCLDCESAEPLCEICARHHVRQKYTRGHTLCDDITKFVKDEKEHKEIIMCEQCTVYGEQTEAVGYCESCINLSLLCKTCASQHLKTKETQNHKISLDLPQLWKDLLCIPCTYTSEYKPATSFCLTCEDPFPLCDVCASYHIRDVTKRNHKIGKGIQVLSPTQLRQVLRQAMKNNQSQKSTAQDELSPKGSYTGKPKVIAVASDNVHLCWEKSPEFDADFYEIRYKDTGGLERWKSFQTDNSHNEAIIRGLMADTVYSFQVRGIKGDEEGRYGPVNDTVRTEKSLATKLLNFSVQIDDKIPPKYELMTEENRSARNAKARTRQLHLGINDNGSVNEKTIMLVGATGSGKSTLVDGIINYVMGVSFEDPFRFALVKLEEEERKTHNQTEWITVYRIAPQNGSRLDYTLNIIDTPGFGDTRGIERDHAIVDQIRHLFSAKGEEGILYLDCVCFIVKAPDARLTIAQRYIFDSIMSLFGKDIESNICTMVTFADGAKPPVLASLTEANLPFGKAFQFNNSALFAENKNIPQTSLSPMFWEMGCKSFQTFFDQLKTFQTRSLSQTKDVLTEREHLKSVIANLQPQVSAGLSKLSELRDQLDIFKRHKSDIENNKDFEYQVDETKQFKVDLPRGQHVTNCLQCNVTCHENCAIADDEEKAQCAAMSNGYCKVCTGGCIWSDHKNTPYIFKFITETVTKTYSEMKVKYENAKGLTLTHEKYLEELTDDIDYLFENVNCMMDDMKKCKNKLKSIALRPDPLSVVEHIDLMINAEEMDKKIGYLQRIKMLQEFRQSALIADRVENFDNDFKSTRQDISQAVGRTFTRKKATQQNKKDRKKTTSPPPRTYRSNKTSSIWESKYTWIIICCVPFLLFICCIGEVKKRANQRRPTRQQIPVNQDYLDLTRYPTSSTNLHNPSAPPSYMEIARKNFIYE